MLSDHVVIPMAGIFVMLDPEDVDRVMEHNWSSSGEYPQSRTAPGVSLHRFLTDAPEGILVDHINGKPWDNRKLNFRFADNAQNAWNSKKRSGTASQYRGVSIVRRPNATYWSAQICVRGKKIRLGQSKSEEVAARLYDAAAKEHFGEFARINFP